MSEENKNEKKKEEKEDKDEHKIVQILVRAPLWMRNALDERSPPNGRSEAIRQILRDWIATHGGKIPINFGELKSQLNKCTSEMDRLWKNDKIQDVLYLVLKGEPLQTEFIPQIIRDLIKYEPQQTDSFTKYDKEECLQYLEQKLEADSLLQKIKSYRLTKYGVLQTTEGADSKEKKTYVPLNQRPRDAEFYETTEQYEARRQKEIEEQEAEEREEEEERAKYEAEHPEEDEEDKDFEEGW